MKQPLCRALAISLVCVALIACSDDSGADDSSSNAATSNAGADAGADDVSSTTGADAAEDTAEASPAHERVVTADWLNGTLTLFDYAKLTDGEDEATLGVVDLSEYAPGPMQLEIVPGGGVAVVSVGPGFFDGALGGLVGAAEGTVPEGGTLLIVDLDAMTVRAELETRHVPMGIAISPDGTRAYTANYGTGEARGDSMSIIDLTTNTILEEITVGNGPEQVALSEDGSRGVVNLAGGGGVVGFSTSDPSGTLTGVIETGRDPSDVVFVGPERVVVANSQSFDAVLVDLSGERALSTLSLTGGGFPYGVERVPGTSLLLFTGAGVTSTLRLVAVSDDSFSAVSSSITLEGGNFPMNAAVSGDGRFAFVPHAADGGMSIVDLSVEGGAVRSLRWLSEPGPTYVALY